MNAGFTFLGSAAQLYASFGMSFLTNPWFWIFVGLVPIAIPVVIFLITFLVSVVDAAESSPLAGTAKLNCYHCGNETEANRKTCQHCGGELQ